MYQQLKRVFWVSSEVRFVWGVTAPLWSVSWQFVSAVAMVQVAQPLTAGRLILLVPPAADGSSCRVLQ